MRLGTRVRARDEHKRRDEVVRCRQKCAKVRKSALLSRGHSAAFETSVSRQTIRPAGGKAPVRAAPPPPPGNTGRWKTEKLNRLVRRSTPKVRRDKDRAAAVISHRRRPASKAPFGLVIGPEIVRTRVERLLLRLERVAPPRRPPHLAPHLQVRRPFLVSGGQLEAAELILAAAILFARSRRVSRPCVMITIMSKALTNPLTHINCNSNCNCNSNLNSIRTGMMLMSRDASQTGRSDPQSGAHSPTELSQPQAPPSAVRRPKQ